MQDANNLKNILSNSQTVELFPLSIAKLIENTIVKHLYRYINYIKEVSEGNAQTNNITLYNELFALFNQQCILCLTNVGTLGVNNINCLIEKKIKRVLMI